MKSLLCVRGGEMIPVDGTVIGGQGAVNEAPITAALLGWIGPIQAAMIHLGPDILVFLNSVKLMRVRIKV